MIITDGTHLISDTWDIEELHRFAHNVGLKREWFQDNKSHPHYDITTNRKLGTCIKAGAILRSESFVGKLCYNKLKELKKRDT